MSRRQLDAMVAPELADIHRQLMWYLFGLSISYLVDGGVEKQDMRDTFELTLAAVEKERSARVCGGALDA